MYNLQSIVHNNCWEYKPWSNIMSTAMVLESHKRLKLPLLDPQNHLSGHCHHQRFWTNASVLRGCSYKCSLQLGDSILACHFGWPTLPILMGDKLAGSVEIVILFCHECPARPHRNTALKEKGCIDTGVRTVWNLLLIKNAKDKSWLFISLWWNTILSPFCMILKHLPIWEI